MVQGEWVGRKKKDVEGNQNAELARSSHVRDPLTDLPHLQANLSENNLRRKESFILLFRSSS
jgi:hypothetical protein